MVNRIELVGPQHAVGKVNQILIHGVIGDDHLELFGLFRQQDVINQLGVALSGAQDVRGSVQCLVLIRVFILGRFNQSLEVLRGDMVAAEQSSQLIFPNRPVFPGHHNAVIIATTTT